MLPAPTESKNDPEDTGSRCHRNIGPRVTAVRHSRYLHSPPDLIQLRGMRDRPVQRLMTQFQGISDGMCVTHAAVWLARYCAGILYLGGRPHSCRQMYAVRSMATRPHLSSVANGSAGTHIAFVD